MHSYAHVVSAKRFDLKASALQLMKAFKVEMFHTHFVSKPHTFSLASSPSCNRGKGGRLLL